ncbi:MAG: hypothetical protein Q4A58_00825 [Fusobacterium sp.]|uniref:toxin-antitoxin system YwqK family antitoxin n=1 Tax=Fusobacterium sp. TaxID=68766 RepID=UPI0026DD16A9|nr:hypothetical protein [Fusobacterium sp.]MDO4689825.1 hypothetical protein [Fusobacterium sp.]
MEESIWKIFYENGNLKEECPMRYGRLHGIATLYNEDGSIKEKRIYENDILMGNPFKGAEPEDIVEKLGLFLINQEEWELSKKEDEVVIEIDEKLASMILFEK